MKKITYIQLSADHAETRKVFESLMYEYLDEMNEHSEQPLSKEFQKKWINHNFSRKDEMIFECYLFIFTNQILINLISIYFFFSFQSSSK